MTCIVGVEHGGKVYIGGDSAGVAGYSMTVVSESKVFQNGPFVMGFTTSFRMGQLLHYKLTVPEFNDRTDQVEKFMVTTFIDAVRNCLRDGGWLAKDRDVEVGGTFLVGFRGQLFLIGGDFQVTRTSNGYAAVGCGDDIALGALHGSADGDPQLRILAALRAAEHHSAVVIGPFTVVDQ